MRTILIPLILICSLTQFVSAQGKKSKKIPNCGGVSALYHCYAPEICTDVNKENDGWMDHGVVHVLKDTLVTEDCPVIFRYHMNSAYSMFIWIEAFQDTVISAEFTLLKLDIPTSLLKHKFSCEMKGDKIIGMHEWEKLPNGIGKKEKLREDVDVPPKMLKCEYTVRSSSKQTAILERLESDDLIMFRINGIPTKETSLGIKLGSDHNFAYCNPDKLIYYKPVLLDHNKLYEQVQYVPGTYECKEFYNFEYRKGNEVKENAYKLVTLTCPATVYVVGDDNGDTNINKKELLDVRCAAEAKYFCNYNVKIKQGYEGKGPKLTQPDWQTKTPTKLECPAGQALVIDGDPFPTTIPPPFTIQCVNYGSRQLWTIEKIRLTEEGPEVYCSDDFDCKQMMKISGNQVPGGYIDAFGLPKCLDGGTLLVDNQKVSSTSCNKKTGKFVYSTEAESQTSIDGKTQFLCKYPPTNTEKNKAASKKNKQIAIWGALGAGFGALGMLGTVIGVAVLGVKINKKRQQKREMAANVAIWEKWCMVKEERDALAEVKRLKKEETWAGLKKKNKMRAKLGLRPLTMPKSSAPSSGGEIDVSLNWNELIMSKMHHSNRWKSHYRQCHEADVYEELITPVAKAELIDTKAPTFARYTEPDKPEPEVFSGLDCSTVHCYTRKVYDAPPPKGSLVLGNGLEYTGKRDKVRAANVKAAEEAKKTKETKETKQ